MPPLTVVTLISCLESAAVKRWLYPFRGSGSDHMSMPSLVPNVIKYVNSQFSLSYIVSCQLWYLWSPQQINQCKAENSHLLCPSLFSCDVQLKPIQKIIHVNIGVHSRFTHTTMSQTIHVFCTIQDGLCVEWVQGQLQHTSSDNYLNLKLPHCWWFKYSWIFL